MCHCDKTLQEGTANKKVIMGRLGKELRMSLSDPSEPSELASAFSSPSAPASSLAAHSEHILAADSASTVVLGTGPRNSKKVDPKSEEVGLTPEETEIAGAVAGGLILS